MKKLKYIFIFFIPLLVLGDYQVKITLKGGAKFSANNVNIINNQLICDTKKSPIKFDLIEFIEFEFTNLTVDICESMAKNNRYVALEGLLEEQFNLINYSFESISNNLGIYYYWLLKSQIWNENFLNAEKTIEILKSNTYQEYNNIALMYYSYIKFENDNVMKGKNYFDKINISNDTKNDLYLYLKAKIAFFDKNYIDAQKCLSMIIATSDYKSDWVAPALLFKAEIFLLNGKKDQCLNILNEIRWVYSGTKWDNKTKLLENKK